MKYRSPAKCILSGEHTVLRGGLAVAYPIQGSYMGIAIEPSTDFDLSFSGTLADEVKVPFWLSMERALDLVAKKRDDLKGHLNIENTIPLGSGLGASASLCVVIAKLFIHYGWLHESEAFNFSKKLEDVFHGESSGLDVAVSLNNKGVLFHRENGTNLIESDWRANLYLTYSGNRGLTADCIKKVKAFILDSPKKAENIDTKMKLSVDYVLQAIKSNDLSSLAKGMDLGNECFQEWGLVNANMREHIDMLRERGAISVKATGSGDGGYILSLWPEGQHPNINSQIALF